MRLPPPSARGTRIAASAPGGDLVEAGRDCNKMVVSDSDVDNVLTSLF